MISLVLDDQAAHLVPHLLNGDLYLANIVAALAGGAEQERIEHGLVELSIALRILAKEVPATPCRFAFPLATIVLVTDVYAVATLSTGIAS